MRRAVMMLILMVGLAATYVVIHRRSPMKKFAQSIWSNQDGQDVAEYAVMLAVILVIVVGTIRLVGSNANNVFSSVASSVN